MITLRLGLGVCLAVSTGLGCNASTDDRGVEPATDGAVDAVAGEDSGSGTGGSNGSDAGPLLAANCPNGVLRGDYEIKSAAQLASFESCSVVAGSLYIELNDPIDLTLPLLTSVGETLSVSRTKGLISVSLPALTTVGLEFWIFNNTQLTTVTAPKLKKVSDALNVSFNRKLTSLSLPSLETVGGDVTIQDNGMLPTAQANALVDQLVGYRGTAKVQDNRP